MSKKELTNIDDILTKLNKQYGTNTIYKISDHPIQKVDIIPTGSAMLDAALVVGGLPRGRAIEMYGESSSGKTTVALSAIAEAQKLGLKCFFIDAEYAFDPNLATGVGVNVEDLYFCQPNSGEEALDVVEKLIESGVFALGVVDSVASLVPMVELEGDISDQQMGLQARLLGKHLRKCVASGKIANGNTCVIYINQTRAKMGGFGYGPQKDTPGGAALKFHSSVRLEVKRIGSIKEKDTVIGNELEIVVTKNKLAPPFRKAQTNLYFGIGFSKTMELIEKAIKKDIIEKKGISYFYNDTKIGKGLPGVKATLDSNVELFNEIQSKLSVDVEE